MKPIQKEANKTLHIHRASLRFRAVQSVHLPLLLGIVLLCGLWPRPVAAQLATCSPSPEHTLSLFQDRYSLLIGAFAQVQYATSISDQSLTKSDFTVPRARICASGHAVTKRLRYRLMIGRSIQRELEVNDAFVEWEPIDGIALRLGRMKLPIIHEWIESAQPLATVDRALASRLLLPGRDYGARVSGLLLQRHVEYIIGVWNGDGDAATRAADTSPAVVARLALHLTGPYVGAVDFDKSAPAVSLEVGTMWNRWKPPSSTNPAPQVEDILVNASALFRYAHFDGAAEYITLIRRDDTKTVTTQAGYLRLTYFVPRLRSAATLRGSLVDVRQDKPDRQLELEADVGFFLDRHRLKAVLRYAGLLHLIQSTAEHQLGLQAQIAVY